jgi:peptidoglycan hydrolase-like protein with peptidoglycan-binding domain
VHGVESLTTVRGGSLTAIALVAAVALAVGAAPAHANPQQAGIQVALRAMGLYCGPIDGDVGPATVAAIKEAQKRAGLPVTGIPDAKTRAALGPLGRPLLGARVLRPRDFGLDVAVLQFTLLRDGLYHGALDGYLGHATETAIRRYQRRVRLAADGVVGPMTVTSLSHRAGVPVKPQPALSPTPPPAPPPTTTYVVQPGDTLTTIAGRYGVSLGTLATANKFDPASVLLVGRKLTIPVVALDATPAAVRERLDYWSGRIGVSPSLVRALAWMESGYQPRVVSSAGARGVLQTLPMTRQYVEDVLAGHPIDHTLDGDIEVGVLYLHHLLDVFGGDQRLALAAWYQGERAVRTSGPYNVTKPFVDDVLALEQRM